MPLEHGASDAVVSRNIREMVDAGHPQRQAVAAAMRTARESKADGGLVADHLKTLGFRRDNPGGDWEKYKQQGADAAAAESGGASRPGWTAKGFSGALTGSLGDYPLIPTRHLATLSGVNNEEPVPGSPKYERLMEQVREQGGFDPHSHPVFVAVNHRGEAYLAEGNHRTAVAHALGVPKVRAEVRWFNGGEKTPGKWSPQNVARMSLGQEPEFAAGGRVGRQGGGEAALWEPGGWKGLPKTKKFDAGPAREPLFDMSIPQRTDAPQMDMPEVKPTRSGYSQRVMDLTSDRAVRDKMLEHIARGVKLGAKDWYNAEPLRQEFIRHHGQDDGNRMFRRYMDYVAATSPRSQVPANIRNASYYFHRDVTGQGQPERGTKNPNPYGHFTQKNQQLYAGQILSGEGMNPQNNPKPIRFAENLKGNYRPATIDMHAFKLPAMLAQDPRFLTTGFQPGEGQPPRNILKEHEAGLVPMSEALARPAYFEDQPNKQSEYAPMERYYQGLAHEAGMSPAETQASAWVGGGNITGLGTDETKTFMQLLNDRIHQTAHETGIHPYEVRDRFIRGEMPLRKQGGRVGRAEGGPLLFHSNIKHHLHTGPIHSHVSGRTDHLPMHVPSGSYVLPADVVSAHGEGNTIAGFKVMRRLFGGGPYGSSGGPYNSGAGPYGERLQNAAGGWVSKREEFGEGGYVKDVTAPGGHRWVEMTKNPRARTLRKVVDGAKAMPVLLPGMPPEKIARGIVDPGGDHYWWDANDATHHEVASQILDIPHGDENRMEARRNPAGVLDVEGGGVSRLPPEFHEQHAALQQREAGEPPAPLVSTRPTMRRFSWESRGGRAEDGGQDRGVPIVAAGGEYVLGPEQVRAVGRGDSELGCRVLDEFVKQSRAKNITTLQKLPGPARD